MTHPHTPPEASPSDSAFLRAFAGTLAGLLVATALLVLLADPVGRFHTGLLPPALTTDRDEKARLYLARSPRPELLVLGSSRSKTLDPACFEALTGRPGFNFAVNGAGLEDLLAVLRFVLADSGRRVRAIYAGLEPEFFRAGGQTRALLASRMLRPFAPGEAGEAGRASLMADLFGWQVVSAALRSVSRAARPGASEVTLAPDGLQHYVAAEAERRRGVPVSEERIEASIRSVLNGYDSFGALDTTRVRLLEQFLGEARAARIEVTAFIPPVHPAFARTAAGTPWAPRSAEAVRLLQALEGRGLLRYVETRTVPMDATAFIDALHFLAPAGNALIPTLVHSSAGCAVQ